jgi:hypothetical protein
LVLRFGLLSGVVARSSLDIDDSVCLVVCVVFVPLQLIGRLILGETQNSYSIFLFDADG